MTATVTTSGLRNPAPVLGQSTLTGVQWTVAAGTSDAIQGAYAVPNTTLVDGLILGFRAKFPNSTTIPTFSPDGLPAAVITQSGGQALAVGSIPGSTYEALVRYNAAFNRWELLNPAPVSSSTSSPFISTFNLVDLMNSHYGIGGWTQRTGVGTGTDIAPAIIDGLNKCRATNNGRGTVFINSGQWLMSSTLPSTLLSGNFIKGDGSQSSLVWYNVTTGGMWTFNGEANFSGGGLSGMTCILESGLGNTNAYGILSISGTSYACDEISFENVYITSHDASTFWYDGFHIDASLRTANGLQGARVGHARDIQIFSCRNVGAYLSALIQWDITNLGIYTPSGTGGDMYITGQAPANQQTEFCTVTRLNIPGTLWLSNASQVMLDGKIGTLTTSNSDFVWGWLHVNSGVTNGALGPSSNLITR